VSLAEQELLTLPDHMNSPPVSSWVRFAQSLVICVWPLYCLFFLQFTDSDYPFGIFTFVVQ
jgi:hypothetical protein